MTGAGSGTFSRLVEECFLRELAPLEFASVAVEDHDTLIHSEYPDKPRRVGHPMAEEILRALPVGIPECAAPVGR